MSLRDLLSRLSPARAARLLGKDGNQLLLRGGKWDVSIADQVTLHHDRFRLRLPEAVVDIALDARARQRLRCTCSGCSGPCEHVGAALSLILEEKLTLGLAQAPPDPRPVEGLSEEELIEQALAERAERAWVEKMRFVSVDPSTPWTDYTATSAGSGKTYRVALRGESRGDSYCSCPDFRKNTLGTCKHILQGLDKARRRFPAAARSEPYCLSRSAPSLPPRCAATTRPATSRHGLKWTPTRTPAGEDSRIQARGPGTPRRDYGDTARQGRHAGSWHPARFPAMHAWRISSYRSIEPARC